MGRPPKLGSEDLAAAARIADAVYRRMLRPSGFSWGGEAGVFDGTKFVRDGYVYVEVDYDQRYGWDNASDCFLGGGDNRYAWYRSVFDFVAAEHGYGRCREGSPFPEGTRFGSFAELELSLSAAGVMD